MSEYSREESLRDLKEFKEMDRNFREAMDMFLDGKQVHGLTFCTMLAERIQAYSGLLQYIVCSEAERDLEDV